ncbi:MAG: acyltransferase family protein [Elusimicrobiota bacterium]
MSGAAEKDHRIPSLDGLRAVSIGLVLLGHLGGTRGFRRLDLGIGDYARLGVNVFFVISGFLITRLLLSEYAAKGRVSLKLFYMRRTLRLFPASYVYVACIALLWRAGIIPLNVQDLWHALTYTVNYMPKPSWAAGHLWSLSVEEQFYLLWPFAFVFMKPRKGMWIAAAMMLLGPCARFAAWLFLRGTPYRDLDMFPMVADSLATGCLLAWMKSWLEGQGWYLRLFRPFYSTLLAALLLLTSRYGGYTVVGVFGGTFINVALAILIHRSVYRHGDWMGRILNWKPLAFVGVLSYSLYLWQQLFLNRQSAAWANAFPQNIVLAAGAALGSYFLIEMPLLKLRRRLRASDEVKLPEKARATHL